MTDRTDKGTTRAVRHDRWDRDDLHGARQSTSPFKRARRRLGEFTSTGTQAVDDAFLLLFKADPSLVERPEMQPSYLVNHAVATEIMDTPELRRMREFTVGDATLAAMAAADLEPILETVFDQLQIAQLLADRVAAALADLENLNEALRRAQLDLDDAIGDMSLEAVAGALVELERLREAREAVEAAEENFSSTVAALEAELDAQIPDMAATLGTGMGITAERIALGEAAASAWGFDKGHLQRMPAADRIQLARTLNSPRMRTITDLFGRIRNLSLSDASVTNEVRDEVVDLEVGADLARIVPSELLGLAQAETEMLFLARLADHELMQYAVEGEDEAGRGGIVMCVDGSGSMATGDREAWAKAVMLVLLHQARTQRRQMHVVHFGYQQIKHMAFTEPRHFSPERIIEATEAFWASGTDFVTPMAKALELLDEEFAATGRTCADVVFCTDDECSVPEAFMAEYLDRMHEMKARTWGVVVKETFRPDGPLGQMSEGRVMSVADLRSGRDIRSLFAGLR